MVAYSPCPPLDSALLAAGITLLSAFCKLLQLQLVLSKGFNVDYRKVVLWTFFQST